MSVTLTNTETRKKNLIEPQKGKTIKIYTCGPTVYNYAHIGNFRTYVAEDILRRALVFFQFSVEQVMNITDVDDKTIKGAIEKNVSLEEYTKPYIAAFFQDSKTLNILPAEHYPKATEYIAQMIQMIQDLLEKGHAYKGADESIYFSINSFSQYGRLAHLRLEDLKVGASNRLDDEYDKENIADFVLWKAYDPKRDGKIYWESPFGKGRPGWHLECSAMALTILGNAIDIHCGGVDNIFPHHENEIAQSECCTKKLFVRHWFHVEHLLVEGKKMSKSLQNFYSLRDLLKKGYTGRQIRYLLMQTHYKTPLNFTFQGLEGAQASLERIDSFVDRLEQLEDKQSEDIDPILQIAEKQFQEALADDLQISSALAALFDLIRKVHGLIDKGKIGKRQAQKIVHLLQKFDAILGVIFFKEEEKVDPEVIEALEKRNVARKSKQYSLADELREYIYQKGYLIEDTPKGARVIRRKDGQAN
jgi:cysteinyl-tRNA synthetase